MKAKISKNKTMENPNKVYPANVTYPPNEDIYNQDKEETWSEMKDWIKNKAQAFKNLSGIGTGGNINKLFRMAVYEGKRQASRRWLAHGARRFVTSQISAS